MRHLVARQRAEVLILIGALLMLSPDSFARGKKPDPGLFAYNRPVAFDLKEESAKEQDGVVIRDVNYAAYAPRHGRIKAYLIEPAGKGPFPGVWFPGWRCVWEMTIRRLRRLHRFKTNTI